MWNIQKEQYKKKYNVMCQNIESFLFKQIQCYKYPIHSTSKSDVKHSKKMIQKEAQCDMPKHWIFLIQTNKKQYTITINRL
jgi:hypothetical protein